MNSKKLGKKTALLLGGATAVVALSLAGAMPANALTTLDHKYTPNVTNLPWGWSGTLSGVYCDMLAYDDKGYNLPDAHSTIRHYVQTSAGTVHYGTYAGSSSWSDDSLDYANVVRVGAYFYV